MLSDHEPIKHSQPNLPQSVLNMIKDCDLDQLLIELTGKENTLHWIHSGIWNLIQKIVGNNNHGTFIFSRIVRSNLPKKFNIARLTFRRRNFSKMKGLFTRKLKGTEESTVQNAWQLYKNSAKYVDFELRMVDTMLRRD